MSDATMANIARQLAEVLILYARDRRVEDQKLIAQYHTELCKEFWNEQGEEAGKHKTD